MTKDEHLEQQEAEYRERLEQQIDEDAAVFVQEGYSRSAAQAKARTISENQQAAADDITEVLGTLEEAQSPTPPDGKTAQTKAIAADLRKVRS
jgi:predicted transcriptional regulator